MTEKIEIRIDGSYVEIDPLLRISTYSDYGPEVSDLILWTEGKTTYWYDRLQNESFSKDENALDILKALKSSGADYFLLTAECEMIIDSEDAQLINHAIKLLDIPLDEANADDEFLTDRKLLVNEIELKITADCQVIGFEI